MAFWSRLSIHQYTMTPRPLDEGIDALARAGIGGIGVNRERTLAFGFEKVTKLTHDAGLAVTVYGFLAHIPGLEGGGRPMTWDENLRALDEAVALKAEVVSMSSGGMPEGDRDVASARMRVAEVFAELAPHAAERNLRLALEPLHPLFLTSFGIVSTLGQALDAIDAAGGHEHLGVVVDAFHVWCDPQLRAQMRRAGDRIFLMQLNDWSSEIVSATKPDRLLAGEGCIDFGVFMDELRDYKGWFDVEANNDELRELPLPELIERVGRSFDKSIAPRLS